MVSFLCCRFCREGISLRMVHRGFGNRGEDFDRAIQGEGEEEEETMNGLRQFPQVLTNFYKLEQSIIYVCVRRDCMFPD